MHPSQPAANGSPHAYSAAVCGELFDAACDLCAGQAGHLAQVSPQDAFVGTLAAQVAELPKCAGHPVIEAGAILQRERVGLAARHKGSHLCQCL